jgi:Cof subfamily protein (haloacid dehalogenase superfamily)
MKTLYISDLDGTLLQPDARLSARTISVVNELIEKGMYFSVATARSIASVKHILKDIRISIPVILMNGVCIYDFQKKDYVKVETFPQRSIDALMELIESNRLKGFAYTIKDGVMSTYYEDLNSRALMDFYKERVDLYQKRFTQVEHFSSLSKEPLIYFSIADHKERLEPVYRILEEIPELNCTFYKDNYSPDFWYLEIFSKTSSKYHAVSFLRSYLGFDRIVCFGDNRNDLPLFEACDQRIAVGNAVEELKQKADLVIGKNYQDGVAVWLKQNVKL